MKLSKNNETEENKEVLSKKTSAKEMEYVLSITGSTWHIIKINFIAGITRGAGFGIGITLITAIIAIMLQKMVTLNIPVIGEYITDIVRIVENNL